MTNAWHEKSRAPEPGHRSPHHLWGIEGVSYDVRPIHPEPDQASRVFEIDHSGQDGIQSTVVTIGDPRLRSLLRVDLVPQVAVLGPEGDVLGAHVGRLNLGGRDMNRIRRLLAPQ